MLKRSNLIRELYERYLCLLTTKTLNLISMKKFFFLIAFWVMLFSAKAQDVKLIDLIMFRSLDYRILYTHLKLTPFTYKGIQSSIEGKPRKFVYKRSFFGDTTLNNSELYLYSLDKFPLKGVNFVCHDIQYFETYILGDLSKYGFSVDVKSIKEKGTMTSREIMYSSDEEEIPFKIQISYLKESGKDVVAILIYDYK